MQDYADYPPIFKVELSLKYCPKASFLYISLYKYFLKNNECNFNKKDIRDIFGLTPTAFRNCLFQLRKEGILEYKENTKSYKINFITTNEN